MSLANSVQCAACSLPPVAALPLPDDATLGLVPVRDWYFIRPPCPHAVYFSLRRVIGDQPGVLWSVPNVPAWPEGAWAISGRFLQAALVALACDGWRVAVFRPIAPTV